MNRLYFLLIALHMQASILPAQPTGPERLSGKPPASWACNDTVKVSLDTACRAVITPDMILEGGSGPASPLIRLFDASGWPIGDTVGRAHLGQRLTAVLTDTAHGNNCQSVLLVEDLLPPRMVCTDLTVPCAIGNLHPDRLRAEFSLATAFPLASDNCSGVTLSHSDTLTAASCDSNRLAGVLLRNWTGTDDSGNQSSCAQTIFIRLITLSDAVLPADTILPCSNPRSTPTWTGEPGVYFQQVFLPLSTNQGSCALLITHTDQTLPLCDGSWNLLRTWRLADWCPADTLEPSAIHHTQAINIQDNTPPVFSCPENITVSTGPTGCSRDIDLPDVVVEDACSRLSLFRADWLANGQPALLFGAFSDFPGNNPAHADTLGVMGLALGLPLGTTPIRYTATDDCGNQRSCSFLVTVQDSVVPTAVCNGFLKVALSHDGSTLLNASSLDDGSYDHCGPVFFKARRLAPNFCQPNSRFFDQVRFCCADVGDTIEVVLRIYDQTTPKGEVSLSLLEQYASDCLSKVLVEDNIKPVCTAPPNLTVSCAAFDASLWSYGSAVGSDNCCVLPAEEVANYSQFDSVCSKGTILRTFRVSDCHGRSGTCTQRITVTHEQDYAVRFPDDRVLFDCDALQIAPDYPAFEGKDCALLAVSFADQVYASVPDACYMISRTWKVVNWCAYDPNTPLIQIPNPEPNAQTMHPANRPGPVVSRPGTPAPWAASVVRIRPTDPAPTDFAAFWDGSANGYLYRQTIRVVDEEPPVVVDCQAEVTSCDYSANDPLFWNHPSFADPDADRSDLCEGPVNLSVTATDLCAEADIQFRYQLLLDLNGDGQPETAISSAQLPGFNTVNYGNAANPNTTGGTPTPFDGRPVPPSQQYGFALQVTQTGNHRTAKVAWNSAQSPNNWTDPVLPHGKHRIHWVITDPCGNQSFCTQELVVADCQPPTTVCRHSLAVSLMPSGTATLWTGDLLAYAADNCTPPDQIGFSMRKKGSGQGFPLNAQGQPIDALTFTCADQGNTEVELWSSDRAGNADFCTTSVHIQDASGACSATQALVSGALRTEYGQAVPGAMVRITTVDSTGMHLETGTVTDNMGRFTLSDFPHADGHRTIIPEKDDQHLNGVSTYDLVLISRHILGITPLNSPYKMIAADVNRSASITTLDIVALRKLILGVHTAFPNNTSWRFVDAAHTFPNPSNPFSALFPEQHAIPRGTPGGPERDFIAVKTGDVDGSATLAPGESSSRETQTLFIDLSAEGAAWVEAGEIYTATLRPRSQTLGYQLTLEFNGADLIEVMPGPGISADNFGMFEHSLTASVDGDSGFELTLKAKKSSYWSEQIQLSDKITPSEAYDTSGMAVPIALQMAPHPFERARGLELHPNLPNPFHQQTTVRFTLPREGYATLRVFDAQGRLHWQEAAYLPEGTHERVLRAPLFDTKGVWYCRLDALGYSATRSMLCLDP